jgi:diketogulonate reductase-like aldo/keto reductase
MRTARFGWTGVRVPVIGQGTWEIDGSRQSTAIDAIRAGLDLGMTHVDTAEMYGGGRSEELVGEAIRGRRDEVFLASKVLPSNASYDGTLRACERSLRRLGVDCLDLYLLHWESSHPIGETMRALEKLVDDGLTRFIGVSNFDVPQVKAAQQALRHHRLASNQVLYHPGDRGIERRLLPYCREQEIALVGYSPFGSRGGFPKPGSRGGKALAEVASRHGVSPHQAVLQFLLRQPGVFTIPKAADPVHTRDNAAALDRPLLPEALAALDRAFPAPDRDVPLGMI